MPVMAVEDRARWLHNLAVSRASKLLWAATAIRLVGELLDMAKDTFGELRGGYWIFQRNAVESMRFT